MSDTKTYLCDICEHNNGYFDAENWPYKKVECTAKFKIRYLYPREKKCLQYGHKKGLNK